MDSGIYAEYVHSVASVPNIRELLDTNKDPSGQVEDDVEWAKSAIVGALYRNTRLGTAFGW